MKSFERQGGFTRLPFGMDCAGQLMAGLIALPIVAGCAVAAHLLAGGSSPFTWGAVATAVLVWWLAEAPMYVVFKNAMIGLTQFSEDWRVAIPTLLARPLAAVLAVALALMRVELWPSVVAALTGIAATLIEWLWTKPWNPRKTLAEIAVASDQLLEEIREDGREIERKRCGYEGFIDPPRHR